MLTVAKVTGRMAAGYADYLEGKTTAAELGDYYLKDGERVEAPGRWVSGAAASRLRPAPAGRRRGAARADGCPPSADRRAAAPHGCER